MLDQLTPSVLGKGTTSEGDSSGSRFILTIAGIGAVLISVVESIVSYSILPAQMRIHWTFGFGPYYGVETAPTLLIMTLFPILVASVALGAVWSTIHRQDSDSSVIVRPYGLITIIGTIVALIGVQTLLIIANL